MFCSSLKEEHKSDKNYEHTRKVWNEFKIKAIRNYPDLYSNTGVWLLADIFEQFRRMW